MDLVNRAEDGLFSNTLFGISMLQTYHDLRLWEWVLSHHPPKLLIELGTGNGALSLFFAMQAALRGGLRFVTVDWHVCSHLARSPIPVTQIAGDMWTPTVQEPLRALLADPANHPALLFCDGGNKPKEFQTFVAWLTPGDLAAVHDYTMEFNPADAEPVKALIAELLPEEYYADTHCFTRFWRRVTG